MDNIKDNGPIENNAENAEITEREMNELLRIRRDKLSALCERGQDPYQIVRYDQTHHSDEIINNYDALEGQDVSIAGRMMLKRVMGKASFAHILDGAGSIQIYVKRDDIGEEPYADFKAFDIGDIIPVDSSPPIGVLTVV